MWIWVSTKSSFINLVGLTVGGISAALVAVFSAGTLGVFAASMATTISSSIGVAGGTIYYSWTKWTRPDPQWPAMFKARWDNIKFYKNSNNTGFIKEWNLYN